MKQRRIVDLSPPLLPVTNRRLYGLDPSRTQHGPFEWLGSWAVATATAFSGDLESGKLYIELELILFRLLIFRSKPVMDIVATLTLSTKEIPIDNFTANCQDGGEDKQW